MEGYIEDCIEEYEIENNVKLSENERKLFLFAFFKGESLGEDCGSLL